MVAPDWEAFGNNPPDFSQEAEKPLGMDDGVIFPPSHFAATGPELEHLMRNAALTRTPLRGELNCCVILVDFSDQVMAAGARERFRKLLFSTGEVATGSANEYYKEVSNNKISLKGDIFGPYRMPRTMAAYAGTDPTKTNGRQATVPNTQDMAQDAIDKLVADTTANIDFSKYDNDKNSFVDALIIVHAGRGAEQPPQSVTNLWSRKWTLRSVFTQSTTNVYAFLTIPENAKVGVSVHEMGHLLFGWPDLYDSSYQTYGVGNWCLMGAGEWLGGGDKPGHPSAWCKVNQGWVTLTTEKETRDITLGPVETTYDVRRVWKAGQSESREYFLLENRQFIGKDALIPGAGLLIWHVDDARADNKTATHRKVDLIQADGEASLNLPRPPAGPPQPGTWGNQGDAGDPYPGDTDNDTFNAASDPNSDTYTFLSSEVDLESILMNGQNVSLSVTVGDFQGWDNDNFMPQGVVNATSQIASVSRDSTHTDLFWVARDGTIKHAWFVQGQGWNSGVLVEGPNSAVGGITAVTRASNMISVFFVSSTNTLEHMSWKDGEDWTRSTIAPAGAVHPNSKLAAVSRAADKMQVFWCRPTEVDMAWFQEGQPWGWGGLWGLSTTPSFEITAVARSPREIDVFARESTGALLHYMYSDGAVWAFNYVIPPPATPPPTQSTISATSSIAAISKQPDHIELFYIGDDKKLRHSWLYGSQAWPWTTAELTTNATIGGVTAVARQNPPTIDVFWTTGNFGKVQRASWRQNVVGLPAPNQGWRVQTVQGPDRAGVARAFASTSRGSANLDVWSVRANGSITNVWSDSN